jgi:RHS repeat-associated protein
MHRDALGSITAVTDTDGRIKYRDRYTAFGTRTRTGAQQDNYGTRLGFTGRENAIEGLMQYRSRYYDTGQGRFLSNDTFRGNELTPPSLHRYSYVHNNPVKYADPSGNTPLLILGVPALVLVIGLYLALGLGLYHEFSHPRPGASTASRICIGLVKGFVAWGVLLPFAVVFTWLATWAIVYVAYFAGIAGILPIAMAYIWYYVQSHHLWTGIAFAVLAKLSFELIIEYVLDEYTVAMEKLDYGAATICGARGPH